MESCLQTVCAAIVAAEEPQAILLYGWKRSPIDETLREVNLCLVVKANDRWFFEPMHVQDEIEDLLNYTEENALHLDVWVDKENIPVRADVFWNEVLILSMDVTEFSYL